MKQQIVLKINKHNLTKEPFLLKEKAKGQDKKVETSPGRNKVLGGNVPREI